LWHALAMIIQRKAITETGVRVELILNIREYCSLSPVSMFPLFPAISYTS